MAYRNRHYEQYDNEEVKRLPAGIFFTSLARVEQKEPPRNIRRKDIKQKKISDQDEISYADFVVPTHKSTKAGKEIYLPLLEVSVEVEVVGTVAWSTLTQTFTNRSKQQIKEATYCMPLYDKSTVTSFVCTIGSDKILKGTVKPKEKAKAEFKEAVAKQQVAALLQEHTPEVFETSVGNIPAETTIKVEISYITELKPDLGGDGVLVTIPTSVAPRYGAIPSTMGNSTVNSLAVPEKNGLQIKIQVSSPVPITKIESQTHPVSIEMGSHGRRVIKDIRDFSKKQESQSFDPKKAAATLSDRNACLGKDFILLIHAKDGQLLTSRAISEPHPNIPDHSALMVSINLRDFYTPNVVAPKTASEIIFVADRSGSMGECMETLKTAMKFFLKSLPNNCIFNICSFGTKREHMWETSRPYNQENVDKALDYVATHFSADMGGTEILKALRSVVTRSEASVNTEIITLTDGEVWDTPELFDFIQSTRSTSPNQNTRFFCLGIGEAVSHSLVAGIGRYGGGLAEVVAIDPSGDWMQRVVGMLRAALTPSSWTVDVTLDGVSVSEKGSWERSYIQAPHKIPDFHAFSRSSIYFLLNEEFEGKVAKIKATSVHSGETFTAEIPIEKSDVGKKWVHQLAAKAVLGDLESGQSWIHDKCKNITDAETKAEADKLARIEGEKIGIEWNISSKWTSFIVVDEKNLLEKQSRWYQAGHSDLAELTRPRFEPKYLDHAYQGAYRQSPSSPASPASNSVTSRRRPVMSSNIEYYRDFEYRVFEDEDFADEGFTDTTHQSKIDFFDAPIPAMTTQYSPPTRNGVPPQRPRRHDDSEPMLYPRSSTSPDQSSGTRHSRRDPSISSNDAALVSYGTNDITIAEPEEMDELRWALKPPSKSHKKKGKKGRRAPVKDPTWDSNNSKEEKGNTNNPLPETSQYQWSGQYQSNTKNSVLLQQPRDDYSEFISNCQSYISPDQSSGTRNSMWDPAIRDTEPPISINDPALVSYGAPPQRLRRDDYSEFMSNSQSSISHRDQVTELSSKEQTGITNDPPLMTSQDQWSGYDERLGELDKQMAHSPSLHKGVMDMMNEIQVVDEPTLQHDIPRGDSTKQSAPVERSYIPNPNIRGHSPPPQPPQIHSPEASPSEAYPQEAYPQEAYPQEAYPQEAYSQEAYSQEAYPQEAYPQEAYSQQAYPQETSLQSYSGMRSISPPSSRHSRRPRCPSYGYHTSYNSTATTRSQFSQEPERTDNPNALSQLANYLGSATTLSTLPAKEEPAPPLTLASLLVTQHTLGFFELPLSLRVKLKAQYKFSTRRSIKAIYPPPKGFRGAGEKTGSNVLDTAMVVVYIEVICADYKMLWDLVVQKACAWLAREIYDEEVRQRAFDKLRKFLIIPGDRGADADVDGREDSPSAEVSDFDDLEALEDEQEGREILVSRYWRGGDDRQEDMSEQRVPVTKASRRR